MKGAELQVRGNYVAALLVGVAAGSGLAATASASHEGPGIPGAVFTAESFARECDGRSVKLSLNTHVEGGEGRMTGGCQVHLAPGVTLSMDRVTLRGDSFLSIDGADRSELRMRESNISFDGSLFLFGDSSPFAHGTRVSVSDSSLRAQNDLRLRPAYCATGGAVSVARSDISSPTQVELASGRVGLWNGREACNGSNGTVTVEGSTFTTTHAALFATDEGGTTSVRHSTFSPWAWIQGGGSCHSEGNTPDIRCS